MFDLSKFQQMVPNNKNSEAIFTSLEKYLSAYNIDSDIRIAAFIAECSVESQGFTRMVENLNYKAEGLLSTFPSHFSGLDDANEYAHNQEKIANRVYASRMGNGDENSGDGWKYRGKGFIQITGKYMYQLFADDTKMDIEDIPAFLETYDGAILSACWFWGKHALNDLADNENISGITKKINGGLNGEDEREDKYNSYKDILQG